MSTVTDVLAYVAQGRTAQSIAAEMGIDQGLVDIAIDHGERMGLLVRGRDAVTADCTTCPTAKLQPLACAGCVFAK